MMYNFLYLVDNIFVALWLERIKYYMKSICIKTNNNDLINYLLDKLRYSNLDSVCFSKKIFKQYNNIIIHYTGYNNSYFLNEISYILTIMIIDKLEYRFLSQLLNNDYFYFNIDEKDKILNIALDIESENFQEGFNNKFDVIYNNIYNYLSVNKSFYITGFVNFRLQSYFNILDNILSQSINSYIIEKEYKEFIVLLKAYVKSQPSECDIVHLIYSHQNSILLGNDKKLIDIHNFKLDAKYLSDISFSTNDYILNTLLNVLPKKIYIHLIDSNIDEFVITLQNIFENQIMVCTDCDICNLYKKYPSFKTEKF